MLEVPEDIYESLVKAAEQAGQPVEEVAVQWLSAANRDSVEDPFAKRIGAFASDIPDWADNHDYYIGQAILETMRTRQGDTDPDA